MADTLSPLALLAKTLCENTACRICIQDVSGEYGGILDGLPYEMKYHLGPVCQLTKDFRRGMELCVACKYSAIDRARLAERAYAGCCRFGVWEVVRPVYVRGRISCMIFVGNLLHSPALFRERANALAPLIGCDAGRLLEKEALLCPTGGDFTPWFHRAELLASYLVLLAEHSPGLLSRPDEDAAHVRSEIVKNVMAYTGLYYQEPLTLSRLAQNHYVSEGWLGRLFKRETGMSFSDYLNHVRIRAACELLRSSAQSITAIAYAVGYDSVSYFNRMFKQITDMTPGDFRTLYSGPWKGLRG